MAQGDYNLGHAVAEDDPNRCQAVTSRGQCIQKAVEGSKYCPPHGGNKALVAAQREALSRYRESKWAAKIQTLAQEPTIKNLHSEVGILRMLIEEKLGSIHDTNDLLLSAGPLSDLILKVEKLVARIHDLDKDLEQTLDKSQLIQYAERIVNIIGDEIQDEDARFRIAKRLEELFTNAAHS